MNKLREKKKIKFDAFVIIFLVVVFCYFLTLIIPSGEFSREEINGVVTVIPNSFHSTLRFIWNLKRFFKQYLKD